MDTIPIGLREYLIQHYDEGELRTLAFDLGIDYDSLPAIGKADKARELIAHCARFDQMDALVIAAQQGREPFVSRHAAVFTVLDHMPLDTLPDLAPLAAGSLMPLSRNPQFVGRDDDLKALARILKGDEAAAIGQTAAATGLGGMGKTNLATEFVHRYGQFFAGGVFWLSFANPAAVAAQVALCGDAGGMNLPGFDALTFNDQVASVQQEWTHPTPRLLVFDNCEDEALLDTWRPKTGGCRVLVTSRRWQWTSSLGVVAVQLDVLSRDESIALLCKYRRDLTDADAQAITQELGSLPLALYLAGSFLATYRDNPVLGSPAAYVKQLHDRPLLHHPSLQGRGTHLGPTGHELNVAKTFGLSYNQLVPNDATDAVALQLLARAAYFAPGIPMPRELLVATLGLADDDFDTAMLSEDALDRLLALGLLEEDRTGTDGEGEATVRLHQLLTAFVREVATDDVALGAVEQALVTMAGRLNKAGSPQPFLPLQSHLRYVTDAAATRADQQAAGLCNELGRYFTIIGELAAARPYLERALAIRDQVLGAQHPDTAQTLDNLGSLLYIQGDYASAHPYFERALAIREQVLGVQHPLTASSLNDLGCLLIEQGNFTAARAYLEHALAIREQVLGAQHPQTANSLNSVGTLLKEQGDFAAARPYYERALAINEQVLGARHPETVHSLNNLGVILHDQDDLAAARPYYERALAIREQVLGDQHPDTARSLNNLGLLLYEQGDLTTARPYLERALAIRERVLGTQRSVTASTLNNLGLLLKKQGDLQGARSYFKRALAIAEQVLGPEDRRTQRVRDNLESLNAIINLPPTNGS